MRAVEVVEIMPGLDLGDGDRLSFDVDEAGMVVAPGTGAETVTGRVCRGGGPERTGACYVDVTARTAREGPPTADPVESFDPAARRLISSS